MVRVAPGRPPGSTGSPARAEAILDQRRAAHDRVRVVVGQGADTAIPEALELFEVSAPIADRLRGFLRVGERRWDVVLTRDQRIKLPEEGAVTALQKVIALDRAQDLLARDIAVVDFRNPARPVLRRGTSGIEGLFDSGDTSRTGDYNRGSLKNKLRAVWAILKER